MRMQLFGYNRACLFDSFFVNIFIPNLPEAIYAFDTLDPLCICKRYDNQGTSAWRGYLIFDFDKFVVGNSMAISINELLTKPL